MSLVVITGQTDYRQNEDVTNRRPQSPSVMKAIAYLDVDLGRPGEVRAAECVGAVQQESSVGQIHSLQCHQFSPKPLPKETSNVVWPGR